MCKFQVSVAVRSKVEAQEASSRLSNMKSVSVSVRITRKKGTVIAVIDHPTINCTLKMAGWVKDNFGMHPVFTPGVQMIA